MTELTIAPIIETPDRFAVRIADAQAKWKRVIERMAK